MIKIRKLASIQRIDELHPIEKCEKIVDEMRDGVKRIRGLCLDCGIGLTGYKAKRCGKCNGISKRNNPEIDVKQYRRNWHIQHKYGMPPGEFDSWWMVAKGKCFICDKNMKLPAPTRGQGLDIVAIDHDHKTGKIRGLLCNACNKGIGLFNDNSNIVYKAFTYLGGKI